MTKVPYQQNPERFDYRLTDKGKDLWTVVNALREWGDRWEAPDGPPVELEHRACGAPGHRRPDLQPLRRALERGNVRARRGPGAGEPDLSPPGGRCSDRRALHGAAEDPAVRG